MGSLSSMGPTTVASSAVKKVHAGFGLTPNLGEPRRARSRRSWNSTPVAIDPRPPHGTGARTTKHPAQSASVRVVLPSSGRGRRTRPQFNGDEMLGCGWKRAPEHHLALP